MGKKTKGIVSIILVLIMIIVIFSVGFIKQGANLKKLTTSVSDSNTMSIKVVFHRNVSLDDTAVLSQWFTAGNIYNYQTKQGNRFGYNINGTPKWGTTGQFGRWTNKNHTLLGWSRTKDSTVKNYNVYSVVNDKFIENVYNKKYAEQTYSKVIDLYAVWQENQSKKLKLNVNNITLSRKQTSSLNIVSYPNGYTKNDITYSSSDLQGLYVDQNGKITANKSGSYTIYVRTNDGNYMASCNVLVEDITIKIVFHRNIDFNDVITLEQNFTYGDSGNKFGYNLDGTLKWSKDGQFANFDNTGYLLSGWSRLHNGKVNYTLYSSVTDGFIKNVYNKAYKEQTEPQVIHLYAIWSNNHIGVEKTDMSIEKNDKKTINVNSYPKGYTKNDIIYKSSNSKGLTVNSKGVITGKKLGNYTVYVRTKDNKFETKVNIEVKQISITVIFHKNIAGDDEVVSQNFTYGNSKNRFGYNIDGTSIWGTTGQFGSWDREGYKLKGWSRKKNSKKINYKTYSFFMDEYIKNVHSKKYKEQSEANVIDLYAVWSEKVDLVLFFGQSNMVGSVGATGSKIEDTFEKNYKNSELKELKEKFLRMNEREKDNRDLSGLIDDDILSQYQAMNYVSVDIPSGVAYEYKINNKNNGYLKEINSETKNLGEYLKYDTNKKSLIYNTFDSGDISYNKDKKIYSSVLSLKKSQGTNMIPEFAKIYNQETNHKMVAVFAAYGGKQISSFLPDSYERVKYTNNGKEEYINVHFYIYEALRTKYKSAEKYLIKNGYTIENKFYVIFQGCSDSNKTRSKIYTDKNGKEIIKKSAYYKKYMKVHNNLKKDLGITFGALVETSGKISARGDENTKISKSIINIHKQQEALINNNNDIILGSDFSYRMYVQNNSQVFALQKSSNGVDNSIHLTSASLSQIGKETATNVSKLIKEKE
mgnify:CR=1 FL=1